MSEAILNQILNQLQALQLSQQSLQVKVCRTLAQVISEEVV
jgi:hypothetical protein